MSLGLPYPAARASFGWPGGAVWFGAAVVVVLAFSQAWVMAITGPVDTVPQATSAALRNVFFPVYLLCLMLALGRLETVAVAAIRSPFLTGMVALCFVSAVWSLDPLVTGRRAIAVLFTTLGGAAIAARYRWPSFLEVFATAWAITLVASALMIVLVPSYGLMTKNFPGVWRGVWPHKNILGYDMTVAAVVFACAALLRPRRRRLWAAFAVAALVFVAMSQSMTSIVSCGVAGACLALVWIARRGPAGAVIALWLAAAGAFAVALVWLVDPALPYRLVGKDATLTGRTSIWAAVMRQIMLRPATGYGFGAVWDETSLWGPLPWISRQQGFVVNEAHNSWLGVWLELGYAGLAGAALMMLHVWARVFATLLRRRSAYFAFPFVAVFSLHTITESTILEQNDLIWMMFAATAMKLGLREPDEAQTYSAYSAAR